MIARIVSDDPTEGASSVRRIIASSDGRNLDPSTRRFMEARLGADFGSVRVHTGVSADASARSMDADAYTVGRNIVFRNTHWNPHSAAGRRIIAHELVHVMQQRSGDVMGTAVPGGLRVSHPSDAFEVEADVVADAVMQPAVSAAPDSHTFLSSARVPSAAAESVSTRAGHRAGTPAGADVVVGLQQGAGNRAAAALMVQRHALLDDQDITKAAKNSNVRIQDVVEEEPDVTVLRRARTPALPLLSIQRAVGIAGEKTQKKYVKQTLQAIGMGGVRRDAFIAGQSERINAALGAHKVHPAPVGVDDLGAGGTRAAFRPRTWEIVVNDQQCPDPLTKDDAVAFSSSLYHEARHAEQWFSLIRLAIFKLRDTHPEQIKQENTYTVGESVPASSAAIKAAFKTTQKKSFSKKEKQQWAENLYARSVTPATVLRPARFSEELVAGESGPERQVPAYRALLDQLASLRVGHPAFPLPTNQWSPYGVRVLQDRWEEVKAAVKPSAVSQGFLGANDTLDDNGCAFFLAGTGFDQVQNLQVAPGKTFKRLREDLLGSYEMLLDQELKAAKLQYEAAYAAYRRLPIEEDAFRVQGEVEARLRVG